MGIKSEIHKFIVDLGSYQRERDVTKRNAENKRKILLEILEQKERYSEIYAQTEAHNNRNYWYKSFWRKPGDKYCVKFDTGSYPKVESFAKIKWIIKQQNLKQVTTEEIVANWTLHKPCGFFEKIMIGGKPTIHVDGKEIGQSHMYTI